jgi:hypothetical protein
MDNCRLENVVWKLIASCCWNCGLDTPSIILEMRILLSQSNVHAAAWNVHLYKNICLVNFFFLHNLSSSHIAINFVCISLTGSVLSTRPLTHDKELQHDLSEAITYDNADLQHGHFLNAVYRQLSRQGMLTPQNRNRTDITTVV